MTYPPTIAEMLRCKSLAASNGIATRVLGSGTALQLRTDRVEGGWREAWMFRGPLAGDDLEVFLERINWHNRPPEIRWLEDGAGVLEWTRLKAPVHVDKYVPPPPPPIVEKPADFAFDPNFVPPDDAFDEDSYSRYFTEDD